MLCLQLLALLEPFAHAGEQLDVLAGLDLRRCSLDRIQQPCAFPGNHEVLGERRRPLVIWIARRLEVQIGHLITALGASAQTSGLHRRAADAKLLLHLFLHECGETWIGKVRVEFGFHIADCAPLCLISFIHCASVYSSADACPAPDRSEKNRCRSYRISSSD